MSMNWKKSRMLCTVEKTLIYVTTMNTILWKTELNNKKCNKLPIFLISFGLSLIQVFKLQIFKIICLEIWSHRAGEKGTLSTQWLYIRPFMFLNIKKGVMWRLTSCKWANDSKEGETVVQWWNNIRIQSLYGSLMKQSLD